jgi:hypothetical protein
MGVGQGRHIGLPLQQTHISAFSVAKKVIREFREPYKKGIFRIFRVCKKGSVANNGPVG